MVVYIVSSAFASRLISVIATTEAAVCVFMHASIQCISIIFQCKILWSNQGMWDGWGMLGDLGVDGRLFL
jgi:hypothetical protein